MAASLRSSPARRDRPTLPGSFIRTETCSVSGRGSVRWHGQRAGYALAMRYQRAEPPLKLDGLDAARRFFAGCFADTDPSRESLWVAHVDREARCLHVSRHDGGPPAPHSRCARSSPTPRCTAAPAWCWPTTTRAATPTPSESDCRATRRLGRAPREAIDLTVVDHVIFAGVGMPQLPPDGPALRLDQPGRICEAGRLDRARLRPRATRDERREIAVAPGERLEPHLIEPDRREFAFEQRPAECRGCRVGRSASTTITSPPCFSPSRKCHRKA